MAFGVSRSGGSSYNEVATTTHSVTLPVSLVAGDFLVVLIQFVGTQADIATTPDGWTRTAFHTSGSNISSFYVFTRRSDGAEGATLSVTTSASVTSLATCCAVEDAIIDSITSPATGTGTVMAANDVGAVSLENTVTLSYNAYWTSGTAAVVTGWPSLFTAIRTNPRRAERGLTLSLTNLRAGDWPTPSTTLSGSSDWLAASIAFLEDASPPPAPSLDWSLGATFGSDFTEPNFSRAERLNCCGVTDTNLGLTFGSDTWWADPEEEADGLSRYYPLAMDKLAHDEVLETEVEADIQAFEAIGRDIANGFDASAGGPLLIDVVEGKMCELPEIFQGQRFYSVPIDNLNEAEPEQFQFPWNTDWTISLLFNISNAKEEQTLIGFEPGLRLGIAWNRQLTIAATETNGAITQGWSTRVLPADTWVPIAYRKAGNTLAGYIAGIKVVEITVNELPDFTNCTIGVWQNGTVANGKMQDVRFYNTDKAVDFLLAEADSYCADWVVVLDA